MKRILRWEQGEFSQLRPIVFHGWPGERQRPSSFRFERGHFPPGGRLQTAQLYWRLGWTALLFWNQEIYFADEMLTFDGMMELLRSRFPEREYLRWPIEREYVD